jgi:hypothetical protein
MPAVVAAVVDASVVAGIGPGHAVRPDAVTVLPLPTFLLS